MNRRSVIVIDDDDGVLESLVSLFEVDGYRATGFSSGQTFLEAAGDLAIDCVVTDFRMPGIDGLALLDHMHQMGLGDIPAIVVSGHADVSIAVAAMQRGVATVLEKPFAPERLLAEVAKAIGANRPPPTSSESAAIRSCYETLSPRERETLSHLLKGSSSKVAAIALGISPRTVDIFRANILRKMEAPNLAGLATRLAGAGLHARRNDLSAATSGTGPSRMD